jgi:DNA-damage-inducible protein D
MDKQLQALHHDLEAAAQRTDAGSIEFWFARDLQAQLGYTRWENFQTAIQRAVESCETTGHAASDHLRGVTKMIELGKGGKPEDERVRFPATTCYPSHRHPPLPRRARP